MLINKGTKNVDLIKLPQLLNFSLETEDIQKKKQQKKKSLHDCVKVFLAFAKKLQEMSSSKHSKARPGSSYLPVTFF